MTTPTDLRRPARVPIETWDCFSSGGAWPCRIPLPLARHRAKGRTRRGASWHPRETMPEGPTGSHGLWRPRVLKAITSLPAGLCGRGSECHEVTLPGQRWHETGYVWGRSRAAAEERRYPSARHDAQPLSEDPAPSLPCLASLPLYIPPHNSHLYHLNTSRHELSLYVSSIPFLFSIFRRTDSTYSTTGKWKSEIHRVGPLLRMRRPEV